MVILRQEQLFKYNVKGKFVDCWIILTHELDGPVLSIYKDQGAKKLLENRPKPFEPKNDWEAYWDNPPKFNTEPVYSNSLDVMRSSGIAMSVDALNVIRMEENRRASIKPENKGNSKMMYNSTPALDSAIYTSPGLQRANGGSSSRSSTISKSSSISRSRASAGNRVVEEALSPIYELKRQRELTDRQKGSTKNRLYEPKSSVSPAMESDNSVHRGKRHSKKTQRYIANRRDSTMSNSGFESGDTSSAIMAYANPVPSRQVINIVPFSTNPPSSILKNKSMEEIKQKHKMRKSSFSSTRSGYSTNSASLAKSPSKKLSVRKSSGSARSLTDAHVSTMHMPHNYINGVGHNYDNHQPKYSDAEVQTEQSNDARPTVPLIAIGHYPAFDDARNNNDFQSQVDRLRDMSLERNKELPSNNQLTVSGHSNGLTPPSPPVRKNTPATIKNQRHKITGNFLFSYLMQKHLSSSDDSMSSDFDDDDQSSSDTVTAEPGEPNGERKESETRLYRISVENSSQF
ncbi:hypothetical protein DdX_04839 [Ditylenchus destructor]|uniref:Uncharacterized protein n=1 Tax=Ditylenchus destructor TaxID=166010 RepID=A0AAD4N8L2_9BILA|nr:hypothetical protein DdX_04839 [Ditylenchus destructor]